MEKKPKLSFKYWQWHTIIATMIGYALYYFVRKNFSIAMPGLAAEFGISKVELGLFITLHGIIYGLSRFVNGVISDRGSARVVASIGLFACAVVNIFFGFSETAAEWIAAISHKFGEGWAVGTVLLYFMGIVWVINGYLQGMGVPPFTKTLTQWIRPNELATKMSVWNMSHSIGAGLVFGLCGWYIMPHMGVDKSASVDEVRNITYNYATTIFKDDIKKSDDAIAKVVKINVEKGEEGYLVHARYTLKANTQDTVSTTYDFSHQSIQEVKGLCAAQKDIAPEDIAKQCNMSVAQAKATQTIIARSQHVGAWRYCFLIPAIIALLGAMGVFFFVKNSPSDVGYPEIIGKTKNEVKTPEQQAEYKKFVRRKVFGNRLIWTLSLTNFFVYVVRFAALDWGPTLLTESKGLTLAMATTLCIVFEFVGGNIGMVFFGWLTDHLFKNKAHRTCLVCMLGAAVSIASFWFIPDGASWWVMMIPFTFIGFFIYGPQALLGIAAANQATNKAAATANGILGIFGYASTLISGVGFGFIAQEYGWNAAYMTILIMALLGAGTLLTMWNAKADGYDEAAK